MGSSASATWPPPQVPMRCRESSQVPKCFRNVKCPYVPAQTVFGRWGAINFSLVGPPDGEVVVCFHGLNGSRVLFNDLGNYISKQGRFRVLSFDLYGHGLSNAPKVDMCPFRDCRAPSLLSRCFSRRGRYDLDFFVDQTEDLLSLLGMAEEPVNLIGFSLGGTIAVAYALRHPAQVLRIAAISPAGFIPHVPKTYYLLRAFWLCVIPIAPHCICTCLYKRERFARSMRGDDPDVDDEVITNLWQRFVWQLYVKRGVASATLAICHRIPMFQAKPMFQEAGQHPRPVLLIWGEQDNLNPPHTVGETVRDCFSNVQMMIVRQAGHIAICDQPRQVVLAILDFLRRPPDTDMRTVKIVVPSPPKRVQTTASAGLPPRDTPPAPPPDPGPPAPPNEVGPGATDRSAQVAAIAEEFLYGNNARAERAAQMPVPVVLGIREDQEEEGGASGTCAAAATAAAPPREPRLRQLRAGSSPPVAVVDVV